MSEYENGMAIAANGVLAIMYIAQNSN